MHHALEIQEILLNIFGHCHYDTIELLALARTCRAFKEPALDVLWESLSNLSPLAQCIPEASRLLWMGDPESHLNPPRCYSFYTPLTQDEWDVLRSYTRRVRSITSLLGLNRKSLKYLWRNSNPEPLFPNVRHLYFEYTHRAVHFLLMPFPSLTSLDVEVCTLRLFEDSIDSLAKTSPHLRKLLIYPDRPRRINTNPIDTTVIHQWRNLQTLICAEISLDMSHLVHLSSIPAFTQLCCKLPNTLPDQISSSDPPLVFSNLDGLMLYSETLYSISSLLFQTRFPAVTSFVTYVERRPSRPDLSTFSVGVQASGFDSIQNLHLTQTTSDPLDSLGNARVLGLEDLRPYMVFSNIRHISLDMDWQVEMTDSELLSLGFAWPHLEDFGINRKWGWNTLGGITPNGLLELLQACPSLGKVGLAIDIRSYTQVSSPPPRLQTSKSTASRGILSINVLDSLIEADSVPAISTFFAGIAPHFDNLYLSSHYSSKRLPNWDVYMSRWEDVERRIKDAVRRDH